MGEGETRAFLRQLSALIDRCVGRFDHRLALEEEEQIDFKIKAKQFIKIYAQVAAILPFHHLPWETLYWFLKFLIPKLRIRDSKRDALDGLLNSVDLSTYGLERKKLNHAITLDASERQLQPQNPNPRGIHDNDTQKDPLDEIIRLFNEHSFAGWSATAEKQRVKFIKIAQRVANYPTYTTQVVNNEDKQNRNLVLEELINKAVRQERRQELDLYKRYASDEEFKRALNAAIARILQQGGLIEA